MNSIWQRPFNHMTNGIYVLTTRHKEKINAMIVSWATQISYDPPMILIAVHPKRYSHQLIEKSKCFALHIIGHTQQEMIKRMMGPDPFAKFANLDWRPGLTGCPILNDCLAWFECQIKQQHQPGNHTLFMGQVLNANMVSPGQPLSTHGCEDAYIGNA
jgi:flavin reductase (DIM6/NTAB) family NADH-FMN oxidoreductase RutF